MSTVSRFVENQSNGEATLNQLPLMHSCDFNTSRLILRSNVLKATDCKVFKDKLLYFFTENRPILWEKKLRVTERMMNIVQYAL